MKRVRCARFWGSGWSVVALPAAGGVDGRVGDGVAVGGRFLRAGGGGQTDPVACRRRPRPRPGWRLPFPGTGPRRGPGARWWCSGSRAGSGPRWGRAAQSSTGRYCGATLSVASPGKFTYRTVALSWGGAAAVASPSKVVSVHVPYILLTPATAIAAETVKATGKLPGVASRPVWVQRKSGTSWVTLVKAQTTGTGSYATSFKAPARRVVLGARVGPAGHHRREGPGPVRHRRQDPQGGHAVRDPVHARPPWWQAKTATATVKFAPVRAGRAVAPAGLAGPGCGPTVATGKQSSRRCRVPDRDRRRPRPPTPTGP